jgi:hypothetical protein
MAKPGIPLSLPYEKITLDDAALQSFIKDSGPVFLHYKAIPCPIGKIEKMSIRSPHSEHNECSNGFIYELAGEFKAPFTSNAAQLQLTDLGILDGSTAIVTIPQHYDNNGKQIYINTYDKLYIKDNVVLSTFSEEVECSITGFDKLTFPVVDVEFLIDSKGKRYEKDAHFSVVNGGISWLTDDRPGFDVSINKGVVYSIRYLYVPFYYVSRLLHEIRIIAVANLDGSLTYRRGPYQISIVREKFFNKNQPTENEPQEQSTAVSPGTGLFGAK